MNYNANKPLKLSSEKLHAQRVQGLFYAQNTRVNALEDLAENIFNLTNSVIHNIEVNND